MLIVVRHGKTNLNGEGSKEKLRGWLPVPLSVEGMKESRECAENFDGLEDIKTIYCSDLVRTVQTATEIAQVLTMELTPCEELRDWNYGDYAGVEFTDKILNDLFKLMDDPNKKAPDGESFQSFLDRTVPFIKKIVEDKHIQVAVTHNRVLTLINALAKNKGKYPDTATLKKKGPVEPSGIMIIRPDWTISYKTQLDTEKD